MGDAITVLVFVFFGLMVVVGLCAYFLIEEWLDRAQQRDDDEEGNDHG